MIYSEAQARTSGAVVQALVWSICCCESNLCEDYSNNFKFSNEETNWLKLKIYVRILNMKKRLSRTGFWYEVPVGLVQIPLKSFAILFDLK